jgi:hypothetical protein
MINIAAGLMAFAKPCALPHGGLHQIGATKYQNAFSKLLPAADKTRKM